MTSSLNSESPTRLVAFELMKLKMSCWDNAERDDYCSFLDLMLCLAASLRCLRASRHEQGRVCHIPQAGPTFHRRAEERR